MDWKTNSTFQLLPKPLTSNSYQLKHKQLIYLGEVI